MSGPSFTFPRDWTISKSGSFRSLCHDGRRRGGRLVTICYRDSGGRPFRVGFSTRKKLAGAVGRNRARRLMREVIRLHQHEIRKDIECLLIWHGPVRSVRYAAAEREILDLLGEAGLLR